MTAPLAHTAVGANPSASTTGLIQRGGRPVATTNRAPAATAARTASRVRGVMVSCSSNKVPSTSQAISAGKVIETVRLPGWPAYSMLAALVLSRSRHAVGAVFLHPRLQLRQADRLGIVAGGGAATEAPRHPEFALRVGILLLHPVQQRVQRLAKGDVELVGGAPRRQRAADGHRDRD